MRGVYVARVNHLGVTSWPLAPTDITAIDCDLLPNVVQMQFFGHWRLLALLGHNAHQCRVTAAGTYWSCKVNMLTWGLASANIASWQQLMKIMLLIEGVDKKSDLVYFIIKLIFTRCDLLLYNNNTQ